MPKIKDRSGEKHGRWTLLSHTSQVIGPSGSIQNHYYKCLCDCGTEREVLWTNIKKKKSLSCGCLNREITSKRSSMFRKPFGESDFNHLFLVYKRGAEKRNILFNLSKEEFKDLTGGNCHYCGQKPRQTTGRSKYIKVNGEYVYNGIDRKDNNIGYLLSNCVTACKICNYAKHTLGYVEFLEWVAVICRHQSTLETHKPIDDTTSRR
jgi:hypothetical protein